MVSELSNVGPIPLQESGRAVHGGSPAPRPRLDLAAAGMPDTRVDTQHGAFAALAALKDKAGHFAQSVRQSDRALAQAQATVKAMRSQVQILVKQYPPFPPGSEQRLDYLKSISALRHQLEAMTIPPLEGRAEPVFYPRKSELPTLDPLAASDEDIAAFDRVLDALDRRIGGGVAELQREIAGMIDTVGQAFSPTTPPLDERQASSVSRAIAGQLAYHGSSILTSGEGIAQIGA